MPLVKMLRPLRLSLDGFSARDAEEGEVLEVAADLAESLTRDGDAEPIKLKSLEESPENKMMPAAPGNKAARRK